MPIWRIIGKQAQHPSGFMGRLMVRFMTRMTKAHSAWAIEQMDIRPRDHVVEIGFGSGVSIEMIADKAHEGLVTGVEQSETMVQMAAKRNAEGMANDRVKLVIGDAANLPLEDASFDKACTINTVYVISDPAAMFKEMNRVLKPGGVAAVAFPVKEHFSQFRATRTPGFHLHELEKVTADFEAAGFQDVRLKQNNVVKFGSNCLFGTKAA